MSAWKDYPYTNFGVVRSQKVAVRDQRTVGQRHVTGGSLVSWPPRDRFCSIHQAVPRDTTRDITVVVFSLALCIDMKLYSTGGWACSLCGSLQSQSLDSGGCSVK